jgi:pantothenate kinase-related protein Tda10
MDMDAVNTGPVGASVSEEAALKLKQQLIELLKASPNPIVIGVGGGSASGKTELIARFTEIAGQGEVSYIGIDSYYRSREGESVEQRALINFDHPDALETELLVEHVSYEITAVMTIFRYIAYHTSY